MFVTSALAATEDATHAAGEASGVFPPFDSSNFASQLFWLAISFGIFYWLVKNVLAPRIASTLETRQDRIAQDLAKAREMRDDADAAVAAYEQELATARTNAQEIAGKARDKAKAEAEEIRKATEADLADKIAAAETQIAQTRDKAMGEVGAIAEETTVTILEELFGTKPTKAELEKAISGAR